jgi:two-component system NtrC family sensor kinase
MTRFYHRFFLCICSLLLFITANSQVVTSITKDDLPVQVSKYADVFDANDSAVDIHSILSRSFTRNEKAVPMFMDRNNDVWLRLKLVNNTDDPKLMLTVQSANISYITSYKLNGDKLETLLQSGNSVNYNQREENYVDFTFDLHLAPKDTGTYFIHVRSEHPLELPMSITTYSGLTQSHTNQSAIMGAYIGIIAAFFLYNLFLFFATNDKSYLIYVTYLFALAFAQATFSGWSFRFFWPENPGVNHFAVLLTSGLAGLAGISFGVSFLHTARFTPKSHKLLLLFGSVYALAALLSFTPLKNIGYLLLNYNGILAGITLLLVSVKISRGGYRPAKYYLYAWSAFLIGLIIFILRNLGVFPVNIFTNYILYIGSAIEVILLSIALADKINNLRKEKEASQAEALKALEENQHLIKEQNVILEQRVAERTEELQESNEQLNSALTDLKDAQAQLVNAEKMASLGQLTAGIAHEINNPINFVKSNIKPLELDIKDLIEVIDKYELLHKADPAGIQQQLKEIDELKQEIDIVFVKQELKSLIKGIEDGAERTAEIVRGLRTFSRLDESELKSVNIHDGLDSALVILKNSMPHHLIVKKNYHSTGEIECLPGKLNQVFMNILNNAIQAITGKAVQNEKEQITIGTEDIGADRIQISIKDSGTGMPEEVKNRIFEPFYTTKDVGEGTGLGLAIVYKIIEQHLGTIEVFSSPGNGTEFIINLPRSLPSNEILS